MLATEYMSMGIWESDIRKEATKEGYEAGLAQGIYKKSIEDAKAMLADGMDVNLVSKYTGLSVETIKAELLE